MAGFGSLNPAELDPEAVTARPEETWQDREAQAALEALKLNKPPARSWYDTINDVAHFPHRMFGQLTSARPDDPARMMPENYVYRTINNTADALAGAIHSGATAPHDVASGELQLNDAEGHYNPAAVGRVMDLASLAGGASVAGTAERLARSPGADFRVLGRKIGGEPKPSELAAPYHDLLEPPPQPAYKSPDAEIPTTATAEATGDAGGGLAGPSGGGGGLQQARLQAERRAAGRPSLPGLPTKAQIVDGELFTPGPAGSVHDVAERYMADKDFGHPNPTKYHDIDPEHSAAIARAYDEMEHAPNDPAVRASYEALIKETLAQYQAIKDSGLKITPVGGADYPYHGNPRAVAKDVADNNHMAFFKTSEGFGVGEKPDPSHPMLRSSGERIGDHDLLNNDLFRIVHDYFGHIKNGYGFRAAGEDNAWRSHAAMYSDQARPAMTSETRGQNSWVNYGPHGEFNRTASGADTVYAPQKVGLLPEWTMRDRGSLGTTLASDSGKPGAVIAVAEHAPPFTTAAEPALERIGRKVGTAEQWKNDLRKYGVTNEEMKYRGVDELKPGQPLSREQLASHLESSPVEIKPVVKEAMPEDFSALTPEQQYKVGDRYEDVTGGSMNSHNLPEWYEEIAQHSRNGGETSLDRIFNPPKWADYQLPGGENYRERLLTLPRQEVTTGDISQRLFGKPIANLSEAERDAVVEEMRKAYSAPDFKGAHWEEPNVIVHRRSTDREMDGKRTLHDEEQQSDWHQAGAKYGYKGSVDPESAAALRQDLSKAVPDGPFKDSWHRLALHDQIREAAEKGYDRISWTGGKSSPTNPKNLGQSGEAATKAENGLIKHYDEKLVNAANKIGKAHGVQVEKSVIPDTEGMSGEKAMARMGVDRAEWERMAGTDGFYEWRDKLFKDAAAKGHDIYHMDIPQSLKDRALQKGFSLFDDSGKAGAAIAAAEHAKPYHELLDKAATEQPSRISTRLPTGKKTPEDALAPERLRIDMAAMEKDPSLFAHNVNLVRQYPNMLKTELKGKPHEVARRFVDYVKDNLLHLYDQVPENIRPRSAKWYEGGNKIVNDLATEHGVHPNSSAGAVAALSPQKDWYQNVDLARRVHDIHFNQRNTAYSPQMAQTAKRIFADPKFKTDLARIKGKTYGELSDGLDKAMWLRLYDEAHNPRTHRLVTPEGEFGDVVRNANGAPSGTGWGSLVEIGKAIKSLEANGDVGKISSLMGERHKVRNFYNNLIDPHSPHGDVTIDTHAVAAGLFRPLSGNSMEVAHNFGNYPGKDLPTARSSAVTGVGGTYGLYADAYREAAKARGISPREMQSITWEAIRGLFKDTWKGSKKNIEAVDGIWRKYQKGLISKDDARQQITTLAGGIEPPSWHGHAGGERRRPAQDAARRDSADPQELLGAGVPDRAARGVVGRAGSRAAAKPKVSFGSLAPGAD